MKFLPHQERVIDERSALDDKIAKLEIFRKTDQFKQLSDQDQYWLNEQLMVMGVYSDILSQRINLFVPATNAEAAVITQAPEQIVPTTIEASPLINDMDQFAMLVDNWHSQTMENGNRLLEIPEGTTVIVEDEKTPGETVEMDLNGPYLTVFKTGVQTALHLFKDLPFGVSVEEAPTNANG